MEKMSLRIAAVAILCASLSLAAPAEDLVKELDQMPDVGKAFQMYSGFLPINGLKKQFHYIAVTSEKPDPKEVIFWFNGGPGCSSLFGMTMEIGPYVMGDEDVRFKRNQFAWNKEAHVVYIEMPAGVGYSTCDAIADGVEPGIACYNTTDSNGLTDDIVGQESLTAVQNFFLLKFPEWRNLSVYLAGESYAGIYIP